MNLFKKIIPSSMIPSIYVTKKFIEPLVGMVKVDYNEDWDQIIELNPSDLVELIDIYEERFLPRSKRGKYLRVKKECLNGQLKGLSSIVSEIIKIEIYNTPKRESNFVRHLPTNMGYIIETCRKEGIPDRLL